MALVPHDMFDGLAIGTGPAPRGRPRSSCPHNAHAYDNADRCVCGLGGDELMRPLVGHPEHFPDVTDGYTLAGQVMG